MLFIDLVNFNNPGVTVPSVIVLLTMMLGESEHILVKSAVQGERGA